MNDLLIQLANSGSKEYRLIIGLMSGTSLDGLDIALCKISGYGKATKVSILNYETALYEEAFKEDVKTIFSKKQVDLEKLTLLNASIGTMHAGLINQFLKNNSVDKSEIDCIASHGQTIYHAPKRLHQQANYPNATLQIGDADHLSVKTGVPVISDFRQKHIAAGGEGAPLALYGDSILFSSNDEDRILLNIGGISNFTYLPKSESTKSIVCSDVGPGNTLIDRVCQVYFDESYDKNGEIARSGAVNDSLLKKLLSHPFFKEGYPKTTGPELFSMLYFEEAVNKTGLNISPADLVCTATQFTACAVVNAIKDITKGDFRLFVSGGGAHNKFMMEKISEGLDGTAVQQMDELGISADAKEAVLFAVLANETLCGSAMETSAGPQIMMGKISLPL